MDLNWLAQNPESPEPGSLLMSLIKSQGQPSGGGGGGGLDSLASGHGGIKAQLRQGFLDAGRPDLAKLVGTQDFSTWIGQESGWNPQAVSPANNQGLRNGGLFQFWYGHDFSNQAEGRKRFRADPYQQALWAAQNFDLTPRDIHTYADQIAAGTYKGWG